MFCIIIASGKGGVGKSTVATTIARSIAMLGIRTGLIDMDVDSPSIPTITGTTGNDITIGSSLLEPAISNGIKVFSIGHLIPSDDTPILWEGAKKEKFLQDIFKSCDFSDVEFLVIDMPPGSGDELYGVRNTLREVSAIVVTLPQQLSMVSAKKVVRALKKYNIPILGIIENMSGFQCKCGERLFPFRHGAGKMLASSNGVEFLGEIPIMMGVCQEGDEGSVATIMHSDSFKSIADRIAEKAGLSKTPTTAPPLPEEKKEEREKGKEEGVKEEKVKAAGVGRITATSQKEEKKGKGKGKGTGKSKRESKGMDKDKDEKGVGKRNEEEMLTSALPLT